MSDPISYMSWLVKKYDKNGNEIEEDEKTNI